MEVSTAGLSPETLRFFADLLAQVQLSAVDPDFEEKAAIVSRVKRDLEEAMAE